MKRQRVDDEEQALNSQLESSVAGLQRLNAQISALTDLYSPHGVELRLQRYKCELDVEILRAELDLVKRTRVLLQNKRKPLDDAIYQRLETVLIDRKTSKDQNVKSYTLELERVAQESRTAQETVRGVKEVRLMSVVEELDFEAFTAILSSIPFGVETTLSQPQRQAFLLGAFNRPEVEFPIVRQGIQWKIDLELMPSLLGNGNEVRPAAQTILKQNKINQ